MISGARILVTGVTGQVARPVAESLAEDHEVFGAARFRDRHAREELPAVGVTPVTLDLESGDLDDLPEEIDYVCHFAVAKTNDFRRDLAANGEGLGLLMRRYRDARAFLHCSSTAVYEPKGHQPITEDDPLGDNHRPFGFMPTYSISKIAAEVVAGFAARAYDLPTTIARLSVPYGERGGGWPAFHLELMLGGQAIPVHEDAPSVYNPLHEDDIVEQVPRLLDVAAVPATIVNWAGNDAVSIEEWTGELQRITGVVPRLAPTRATIESVRVDTTRMHELVGPARVEWREGLRRLAEARHPRLFMD
ncbi:MAG TPA: NAD(P)-dependent oxidoreductase [Acidimicrobiales bacterium]|nr:NAD(P)-dependent oxidoreductase [Acidimicrobiales bacterium]